MSTQHNDSSETAVKIENPVRFSDQERAFLNQAAARMPYGAGMAHVFVNSESVVQYLEELAESLRDHAEHCNQNERQLNALRADIAAFRRVMGGAL